MSPDAPPPAENQLSVESLLEGRLHPLTLVLGLISSLRKLILPSIPIFIVGSQMQWGGFAVFGVMVVGTVVTLLMRYFSFRYRIQGRELVTSEGIIGRKERHIPLEQIHEIRIEQNVLQRVFGVVEAVIETAGGEGAEAKLSVLARADAERLRAAVAASTQAPNEQENIAPENASAAAPTIIRKLGLRDLILHGLTSNHLLSALAIFGAVWAFADDVLPKSFYGKITDFLRATLGELAHQGLRGVALIAGAIFLVVMVLGLAASVVGSVVLFFGYTLARRAGELHRSYGLLTQRASSIPPRRIQVLKIEQGMIRRWLGLATLRADVSGSRKGENDGDNKGRDVLLPLAYESEIPALLPEFFPSLGMENVAWKKVSPLAVRRSTTFVALILLLLIAVICLATKTFWAMILLLLLPLIYWLNTKSYQEFGYALSEQFFRVRKGWLGRSQHIVPIAKSQVLVVRQSFFDRRHGLATLSVDTAGQTYTGGSPNISNLPYEEALGLARLLAQKAAQSGADF